MVNKSSDLDALVAALQQTGDYRVLRRLKQEVFDNSKSESDERKGIFLDTETTGLDPSQNEIIELAMIPFTYKLDGQIVAIGEPFQQLRQPSTPIPQEVTTLTGIDDELVKGKAIDALEISSFVESAALIIAHNAAFDRRFAERLSDSFRTKAWACSMCQIPWEAEGLGGTRLKYLGTDFGFFFDGHRALDDCQAGLELLTKRLPKSGELAMTKLLQEARKVTIRLWAEGASYELRETLKTRGYRWSDGTGSSPKAWWVDVPEEIVSSELSFLEKVCGRELASLPMKRVTAYDRFSDRV